LDAEPEIQTARLRLRRWMEADHEGGMIASKLRGMTKCIVPMKAKKPARAFCERFTAEAG
jgi:hypothetical protein